MVDDFFEGVEVAVDEGEVVFAVPHRELEGVVVQAFGAREISRSIGEFTRVIGEEGTGCLEELQQVERTGGTRSADFAAAFGP
ncbi:hypothetical protein [Nocardia carnea]|uniref:hypothetical protein n=1 Tax=Nocardia carnea TaxID=37328 RepID=UPI0024556417|nr:hypothetical protein [Nocardia carnea]